jgi:uncharacterized protein YdhG (YjbR/CyaY superfamily)
MPSKQNRSKEIDAYIASKAPEIQRALEELRGYIRQAAPHATELINYQIPAFALLPGGKRDQQIMFAGYEKAVGFYPHPDVIEAFEDRLKPYKHAKGSVQFPPGSIPKTLVIEMVRYRLTQLTQSAA